LLMSSDVFVAGISALGVLFGLVYVITGLGFLQGLKVGMGLRIHRQYSQPSLDPIRGGPGRSPM